MRKRFDKELYEQNDAKAKAAAKLYYNSQGIEVEKNPKRYGPDLRAFKDGQFIGFIECEIKKVWKDEVFPYETIQFPERKAKYVTQNEDHPVTFFMLNKPCNRALIVEGKDMIESKLKEVPNKYVPRGEFFFQVPLNKAKFVNIPTVCEEDE